MAADRVGNAVLGLFEFVGALASFGARVAVDAFRPPYEPREIARHVYQFGYRSAPLILTAGAAIGVGMTIAGLVFGQTTVLPWAVPACFAATTLLFMIAALVSRRDAADPSRVGASD